MPRVVVTGVGTVNGFGAGVARTLAGLQGGGCAIGEMTVFPTEGFRTHRAAVAPEADAAGWVPAPVARRLSRSDRLALEAAREAWRASGIGDSRIDAARVGVAIGGTTGGMLEAEEELRRRNAGEIRRMRAGAVVAMPVASTADVLASVFDSAGPRITVATACSSSANAIGLAADAIADGRVIAMLAGGTESHCRMTFAGFNSLQAVDPDVCRPFDRRRAGLSLGEGAAILVLEDEDHARRRGAEIFCEIAGYGTSADAHHMTAPHPAGEGAVLAMRRALRDARVDPGAVEYVNAHGTGTLQNDPIETRAIKEVFGDRAKRLFVSSTKSQVGHCLGAAGAIELLATALAIRYGFVPPTVNLDDPDPECDLDYVPRTARERTIRTAISNSYGFGGNNTSIVIRAHG